MPEHPDRRKERGDQAIARQREVFTPNVVRELTELEATLGGRKGLIQALALAPLTPDLSYTLGMLGDPNSDRLSLAQICARGNILPGELLKHIRNAALLRGQVIAAQQVAQKIPEVVAEVLKKAVPYEDACSACRGVGSLPPEPTPQNPNPGPTPCETCLGTGRLVYPADDAKQRLVIDLAQLLPKPGSGGGVNILQQFGAAGGGPTGGAAGGIGGGLSPFERLSVMADRILYGSGQPIHDPVDGELVDEEPGPPAVDPGPPADPA